MLNLKSVIRSMGLAVIAACVAVPAYATVVIDQNASVNGDHMAHFGQSDLAQSFQQTADNIAGAGIFLQNSGNSSPATITIQLWDALPNVGGANELTSGNVAVSSDGQWADVFWSPVAITPATTYYLVFLSDNIHYGIAGDANNGYAAGQVYANSGYQPFGTYDYAFRTYADNAFVNGEAVPEPATLALFGLGLVGLGVMRRRK